MTDRSCIRGCMVRDAHFAACPDFGGTGAGECRGCVPAEARDQAMVCDRCFHRVRRLLDDAPDLVGHLRSIADPTKAAVYDRVVVATSKPEAPAPVSAELIDASADIVATLRDWAASITGDMDGYRLPPGAAADVAHDAARWRVDIILDRYEALANTLEIATLADAVLTRHMGDSSEWGWWSIADALSRWALDDRARWATAPCPECDLKTVRVIPPRRKGAGFRFVCTTTTCVWEADDRSDDGLWGDVFAADTPQEVTTTVRALCGECVAGRHQECRVDSTRCECRCEGDERLAGWVTVREAAELVGRDLRTVQRWAAAPDGLRVSMGRCRKRELLDFDKQMRSRKGGRPKAAQAS